MKIALAGVIEEHHSLYNDIFTQMKSAVLADAMPMNMGLKLFRYLQLTWAAHHIWKALDVKLAMKEEYIY